MVGALKAGLIVMAVFADRIAPYSYDESVPGSRKKPPSVRFMGTDNIGRDMWSRAVYGARISVTVGFATVALATVFAAVITSSSTPAKMGNHARGRLPLALICAEHPLKSCELAFAAVADPDIPFVTLEKNSGLH